MSNNETDPNDTEVVDRQDGPDELTETLEALDDAPVEAREVADPESVESGSESSSETTGSAAVVLEEEVIGDESEAAEVAEQDGAGGLKAIFWPSSRARRILTLAIIVAPASALVTLMVLPSSSPETEGARVVEAGEPPAEDITETESTSGDPVAPEAQTPVQPERMGLRNLVERGELAMRNERWTEARDLLEQALRMAPSTERVMRGRIFQDLAQVSRSLGKSAQARVFESRAREQLLEVFEPAEMLDAAEGKIALGDYRAAQALYSRFLLQTGSLQGEAAELRRRAELGLARAFAAEWRATRDGRSLDRLPEPSFHFGERR